MKAITLNIEDSHYQIFWLFATLQGKRIEDFLLEAAKSTITPMLYAQDYGEEPPVGFSIDKRLGGKD